jgi:hypothetical protein
MVEFVMSLWIAGAQISVALAGSLAGLDGPVNRHEKVDFTMAVSAPINSWLTRH